ncbi:FtsX-like permease family protein [Aeromicrobium terrae]|uniref:FtsX-like permease family protein n=1 Tax=Aeromicrobium terrae TaxID=2498846 RepID=A0A5C8NNC4_9ACTN|nr:FtsX-like permease family protein [Aeromicrobium terrae]TXL62772.1 FtsX-like permease family protein [Aeromicrobium terrae]
MRTMSLARQTVRTSWPAYLGAFVALASGVVLIATTVNLVASVDATLSRLGPSATVDQRQQLDDLTSMFGIMSAVSMFMALFVVGSTFGFVVATRRRELGLLRLVGATGRQVRRLVLGESLVVAVLASIAGCLVATPLAGPVLAMVRRIGVTDQHLVAPAPWLAWAIAAPTGMAVAILGARRASRRAAKVPPVAALQEAAIERGRPSAAQWVVGTFCLAGVVAAAILAAEGGPLFALVASILLPEVVVIAMMCFGPLLIPRLAALLARPWVSRDVTARFARDELRAAVRTTTSVAAPVMAISAIAGSMLISLSFTADWTSAQDRAQLRAPLVVQPGPKHADTVRTVVEDPAVRLVDQRRTTTIELDDDGYSREDVDAVDVSTATAARGLSAVRGRLADLHGRAVAVSRTWTTDSGKNLGDYLRVRVDGHRVDVRIVAVVKDAPDLYGDIMLPTDLWPDRLADNPPDELFVVPAPGTSVDAVRSALERRLHGTDSHVRTADDWIDDVTAQTRRANNLGLVILLGPAGFYAAIAMVNATLIGATQRRRQHRVLALLGATREQLRRVALWQAALVTGAGLVIGGLTTVLMGILVRRAISADLAGTGVDPGMTIPWLPLAAIALTCGALAAAAGAAGARTARS